MLLMLASKLVSLKPTGSFQNQSVISHGNKKPQNRKEKEDKVEKRSNSESKERREILAACPAETVSEDEAQTSSQRKRGQRWALGRVA